LSSAFVRFESRDLASLETVMNIDEIRGLTTRNTLKTSPYYPKTMFKTNQKMIVFFMNVNSSMFKIHKLSNNNIKVCNTTVTDHVW